MRDSFLLCRRQAIQSVRAIVVLGVLGAIFICPAAAACPFCEKLGKTLADTVAEADWVLYGDLDQANPLPAPGTTQLTVRIPIKGEAAAGSTLVLARFLPAAQSGTARRLIFAYQIDGHIEPFRVQNVASESLIHYLRESPGPRSPIPERLEYAFRFLDSPDPAIAVDAYKEFAKASFADVRAAGPKLQAERVRKWLADPARPPERVGLFGLLLGVCGNRLDAKTLAELVSQTAANGMPGLDGLLGGWALLDTPAATSRMRQLLLAPRSSPATRQAALAAIRFVLEELKIDKKVLFASLAEAIAIPEISDLAIDELRKHAAWEHSDRVLNEASPARPARARSAVVRFALRCPSERARKLIAHLRQSDPQIVQDAEQNLRFEDETRAAFGRPRP